jgi:nitrite reductase/ring-hydroxylating ferredoxin subunit
MRDTKILVGTILKHHLISSSHIIISMKHHRIYLFAISWLVSLPRLCNSWMIMMAARKGKKGILKQELQSSPVEAASPKSINRGRGQEIRGVTLPAVGKDCFLCFYFCSLCFVRINLFHCARKDSIKGWEFGNKVRLVCANVKGKYYALQGECPRCAFDLFKGKLIIDDPGFEDLPRVACPTCSTTYALSSGKHGPPLTRQGLAGFVGGLAMTATVNAANADAKAFIITRDDDGKIYCRERS